ncbi:MAG: hypothetical protein ABI601_18315 [bacterium]
MSEFFSGAHLHLLVNHAPVLGTLFALALLLASYFFAPDVMRRTALVVLVGSGIAGAAANYTGESAEDAIRGYPGVKRESIHEHEEMGEKAFIISVVLGVLSIGALARWRRTPVPTGATAALVLATAFAGGAMAYTALLGGRVRHTEVRPGATPADAVTIEPRRPPGPRPPE